MKTQHETELGRPPLPTPKKTYCIRLTEDAAKRLQGADPSGKQSLSRGIEALVTAIPADSEKPAE